mmetsp:Transcript_58722/g.163889  ORF Transcript_58722/g.163889 Transcript_58722/m.163889 type:complete len:136 (-) Transcript_58722:100-507(-)
MALTPFQAASPPVRAAAANCSASVTTTIAARSFQARGAGAALKRLEGLPAGLAAALASAAATKARTATPRSRESGSNPETPKRNAVCSPWARLLEKQSEPRSRRRREDTLLVFTRLLLARRPPGGLQPIHCAGTL